MIQIPDTASKKWSAAQYSDLFGNIIRSRNLDFNKQGYLSLARKPYVFYSQNDDSAFRRPLAILNDATTLYVVTIDSFFTFSIQNPIITASKITSGSPPTFGFQSDGVFYKGLVHASGTSMVCSLSGGSWTSRITGLSTSNPHPLCVSEHQQYLAVGDGNTVVLYDTSYSVVTTLTIPSQFIVTWIRWRGNLLYIGTRNSQGGEARMFIWNGSGTAAQSGYGVQSDWVFSGCEYDSSIAVVTSGGQLLRFNGGGFDELANFPIYYSNRSWSSSASASNLVGKLANRGMVAKGKRLYMNIDGTEYGAGGGLSANLLRQPSGLWMYDPEVGLYHKAGYDNKTALLSAISSIALNVITIGTAAIFETGDPVLVNQTTITGLSSGKVYYAIKVDSTHLKLALSPAAAIAGTALTLSGSVGGSDSLNFNTYRSVGGFGNSFPAAVALIQAAAPNIFNGAEVIYGGNAYNNLGATKDVIMSLGMGKNVGSFITPKAMASGLTDLFQKIFAKFPFLSLGTQKMIIKYKILDRFGMPIEGAWNNATSAATWINSTSFTADADYDLTTAAVGDEIEFIAGAAAGYTAHITNINGRTITIDESMPDVAASDTSDFNIDSWTKYKTISTTDDAQAAAKGFKEMTIVKNAKWIQLKIELRGWTGLPNYGVSLEDTTIVNIPFNKFS